MTLTPGGLMNIYRPIDTLLCDIGAWSIFSRKTTNSYDSGFLSLPTEILLEIVASFPVSPIPKNHADDTLSDSHRRFALLSLSQTCRSLRACFREFVWDRFEVYDGMRTMAGVLSMPKERETKEEKGPNRKFLYKNHGRELMRQVRLIRQDETLAAKVTTMDLTILYTAAQHLYLLSRVLTILPNLHTIQLNVEVPGRTSRDDTYANVFTDYTYPQIRTICVSNMVVGLVRSCPGAKHVYPYDDAKFYALGNVERGCQIEVLGMFYALPKDLAANVPLLKDLTMHSFGLLTFRPDRLKYLSLLQHLHTIRLRFDVLEKQWTNQKWPDSKERQKISIEWMKRVLADGPKLGIDKQVVVVMEDGKEQTFVV